MSSPYVERVAARMRADDAWAKVNRHWSVRAERVLIMGPCGWLYRAGLHRFSTWWATALEPLEIWLQERQRAWLARRYL